MKYYEGNIIPAEKTIFVFGSNPEGRHGSGSAKVARMNFGAVFAHVLPSYKKVRLVTGKPYIVNISVFFQIVKSAFNVPRLVSIIQKLQLQLLSAVVGVGQKPQARDKSIPRADFGKEFITFGGVGDFLYPTVRTGVPVLRVNGEHIFPVNGNVNFILLSL